MLPLPQFQTYDGIDAGGFRLAAEIETELLRLDSVRRISFIGHSLGGLYCRFAAAVLDARGWFSETASASAESRASGVRFVRPMVYISLATPHLGSRQVARQFPGIEALASLGGGLQIVGFSCSNMRL